MVSFLNIKDILFVAGVLAGGEVTNINDIGHGEIPDHMEEICDNAIDDDMDGLVDLNDPDCICEILDPVSLIPNPSFEEMDCCPSTRSELDCATTWIQASEPTTDYLHTCGWMGWANFPPPLPFPDGIGAMGFRDGRVRQNNGGTAETNWKEYAGACLLAPLVAGTNYRFEFEVGFVNSSSSPPINITFFGTSDCENIPFGVGNQAFGCPTNGSNWVRLGSTLVSGGTGNKWVKAAIEVTPSQNITAIAIGPECNATSASVSTYYFFDNLVLADIRSFEFKISESDHPCSNNFLLEVPFFEDFKYQWYKDGITLIGETDARLSSIHGEGEYQVRIIDDDNCLLTKGYFHVVPELTNYINVIICKEDVYKFGTQQISATGSYLDTFKSVNNCDSIVFLELKKLGELADTVQAKIFEGERYAIGSERLKEEGAHLVKLESSIGCDSLVLVELEYFKIFVPNVFSPNGDGRNDFLQILGEEALIQERNLKVYDRWGALLFDGQIWDGMIDGAPVDIGVYTFLATVKTQLGHIFQFAETVTVLR